MDESQKLSQYNHFVKSMLAKLKDEELSSCHATLLQRPATQGFITVRVRLSASTQLAMLCLSQPDMLYLFLPAKPAVADFERFARQRWYDLVTRCTWTVRWCASAGLTTITCSRRA